MSTTKGTKDSCTCESCVSACTYKPGWFVPGEAEKAAQFMKMSTKEFFDKYLLVDWWEGTNPIYILSPAIVGEQTGMMFPSEPQGQCVFLKDGLCLIHEVKPYECRELLHKDTGKLHERVSKMWDNPAHQTEIKQLLGSTPNTSSYFPFSSSFFDDPEDLEDLDDLDALDDSGEVGYFPG